MLTLQKEKELLLTKAEHNKKAKALKEINGDLEKKLSKNSVLLNETAEQLKRANDKVQKLTKENSRLVSLSWFDKLFGAK